MLVLWSAYALGDYTYIVQWRFGEDGSIMPRVGLTGRLAHFGGDETNSANVGAPERALGHVHNIFFCLDFDVDGGAVLVANGEIYNDPELRSAMPDLQMTVEDLIEDIAQALDAVR